MNIEPASIFRWFQSYDLGFQQMPNWKQNNKVKIRNWELQLRFDSEGLLYCLHFCLLRLPFYFCLLISLWILKFPLGAQEQCKWGSRGSAIEDLKEGPLYFHAPIHFLVHILSKNFIQINIFLCEIFSRTLLNTHLYKNLNAHRIFMQKI